MASTIRRLAQQFAAALPNGQVRPMQSRHRGCLDVSILNPTTANGGINAEQLTPVVQVSFVYNNHTRLVTTSTTGSGAVSNAQAMIALTTTAATASSATVQTRRYVTCHAGQGIRCIFAGYFTAGQAGSTQLIGIGDTNNGAFFGFNGTAFGVLQRTDGSDTWVTQSNFNIDVLDGSGSEANPSTLTFTADRGNVFMIAYQWTGFSSITFSIAGGDGAMYAVHRIAHAGQDDTEPHFYMPHNPLYAFVENTINVSAVDIHLASMAAFREGIVAPLGPTHTALGTNTNIKLEGTILVIHNKTTFNGITSHVNVRPRRLIITADGTGTNNIIISVHLNSSISGAIYTDVATTTSVVEYSNGTGVRTGGEQMMTFPMARNTMQTIDLDPWGLELINNDTLIFTGTSSTAALVSIALTWTEDF